MDPPKPGGFCSIGCVQEEVTHSVFLWRGSFSLDQAPWSSFPSRLMASEECCIGCEGITRSWQDTLISSQRLVRDQDFSLQLFPLIKQSIHSSSSGSNQQFDFVWEKCKVRTEQRGPVSTAGWCCRPGTRLCDRNPASGPTGGIGGSGHFSLGLGKSGPRWKAGCELWKHLLH